MSKSESEKPSGPCNGRMHILGTCDRKPSVVREGRAYCWQHDPERLQAQAQEERQKREAIEAEKIRQHEAAVERRVLLRRAGIEDLSNEELRQLADQGGVRTLLQQRGGNVQ